MAEGEGRNRSLFSRRSRWPQNSTLDRIDRRILAKLQKDGRITNQALAEQVALSPSACLARVRRLERDGIIEGYGARLSPWKLDASLVIFAEVWLEGLRAHDLARFEQAIAEIPRSSRPPMFSGPYEYLIKVVVRTCPAGPPCRKA